MTRLCGVQRAGVLALLLAPQIPAGLVGSAWPARVQRRAVITAARQRHSVRLLSGPEDSWVYPVAGQLRSDQLPSEQTLFRHRFLVGPDFCLRMPLDAQQLLQSCIQYSHLSGYIELQIEAFRPLAVRLRWP